MEKEDVERVVFRDVLVWIKEKLINKESRTSLKHYINAWIQTIDDQNAEITKEENKRLGEKS